MPRLQGDSVTILCPLRGFSYTSPTVYGIPLIFDKKRLVMKNGLMKHLGVWMIVGLMGVAWMRPAQAQLGVAAGLNFDNFTDIRVFNSNATLDNSTGWHAGVFLDLALGPLALRPGVYYRDLSQVDLSVTGFTETFGLDVSMIEIPVDVRIRLAPTPLIKPYAIVAPVFAFANSNDGGEVEGAVEDFTMSANVGLGLELSVPGFGMRLFPEIRYAFGLSRFISKEFKIAGQTVETTDISRNNAFMLRLGIGL